MKLFIALTTVAVLISITFLFLIPATSILRSNKSTNPDSYLVDQVEQSGDTVKIRVMPILSTVKFKEFDYRVEGNVLYISVTFTPALFDPPIGFKDIYINNVGTIIDYVIAENDHNQVTYDMNDFTD